MADTIIGSFNSVEGKVVEVPSHKAIDEKIGISIDNAEVGGNLGQPANSEKEIGVATSDLDDSDGKSDTDREDAIIITGTDAANHLLSMRDDKEPALTFRSIVLATILSAFQAVVYQIYNVCHLIDFLRTSSHSLVHIVQTNPRHYSGDFHCSYRLLFRQWLGDISSSRRSSREQMESKGRPRKTPIIHHTCQDLQPWSLELEGACNLLYHCNLCFQCGG